MHAHTFFLFEAISLSIRRRNNFLKQLLLLRPSIHICNSFHVRIPLSHFALKWSICWISFFENLLEFFPKGIFSCLLQGHNITSSPRCPRSTFLEATTSCWGSWTAWRTWPSNQTTPRPWSPSGNPPVQSAEQETKSSWLQRVPSATTSTRVSCF